MKISSRTARMATAAALLGIFVIGGGVSATNASNGGKIAVTTKPPKITVNTMRTKNGALPTTVAPNRSTSTSRPPVSTLKPRVKNGVPKPTSSVKPKGSGK